MNTEPQIQEIRSFWEENPLWTDESNSEVGSKDFFESHAHTVIDDCFAGRIDERIFPKDTSKSVLDLGCGIGFWTVEFLRRGFSVTSADLTENALRLTEIRCKTFGFDHKNLFRENAANMSFKDGSFEHVNCQGVIHHTPEYEKCLQEISRVLTPGGTASVSVYYHGSVLKIWSALGPISRFFGKFIDLKGRQRHEMAASNDVSEIVRKYDGGKNPYGIAFTETDYRELLEKYFRVEETYLHFFPARALPLRMPKFAHRFLDKKMGLMIYATLKKR